MVCIRNDLKVHTQELNLGLDDKFRESVKLQVGHTGLVSPSRLKTFNEESEVEDGEFAVTLRKEELLNRDNCMWLSITGASSPSSCLKDTGLFGYMDPKIDACGSQSPSGAKFGSLLNTKVTFFDGSRVNPIEEASLALDQMKNSDENMVFQENLEEAEVVLWLKNESSDDGSDCYSHTMEKKSMSKSKSVCFTDSSDEQSLFSSSSSSDYSSEVMDLEEIGTDKPLFWPVNSASDWGSDTKWDYFIMSPRKDAYKVDNRINNEDDYVVFEDTKNRTPVFWPYNYASKWDLDAKWDFLISPRKHVYYKSGKSPKTCLDSHGNMNLPKGCNRRLEFNKDSKPSCNMSNTAVAVTTEQVEVDLLTKRSMSKHKMVLEDLLLVDKLSAEGVIEQVLGLGEFDGHEGIESEFNKDEFSLWF
ncbi:hypothetical protein QVD17_01063 [Tagetes erecta]|uniref:Uncharacterized protein n=1 Tax=Tagetes erecta TaxID=13708 RepID=A0AAD8P7T6_TARER|nr:hypothetical protein QVD17_01063 [Tagetes erecta]